VSLPPDYCDGSNLAEGIHICTLQELEERFGVGVGRERLFNGLRDVLQRAGECRFRKVMLFGSFVSAKQYPGDIDLIWALPPGTETGELSLRCRELIDSQNSKQRFGLDVFWCYDLPDALQRMAGLFGMDRTGRKRGLVMIEL
jgi:hypothetical protein